MPFDAAGPVVTKGGSVGRSVLQYRYSPLNHHLYEFEFVLGSKYGLPSAKSIGSGCGIG
jgi:hypothetical protein